MNKSVSVVIFLFGVGITSLARAEVCEIREPPKIPDGATAHEVEMQAAQLDVRSYIGETQEYIVCLENHLKHDQSELVRRYNEQWAKMQQVSHEFDQQLRVYKAR